MRLRTLLNRLKAGSTDYTESRVRGYLWEIKRLGNEARHSRMVSYIEDLCYTISAYQRRCVKAKQTLKKRLRKLRKERAQLMALYKSELPTGKRANLFKEVFAEYNTQLIQLCDSLRTLKRY